MVVLAACTGGPPAATPDPTEPGEPSTAATVHSAVASSTPGAAPRLIADFVPRWGDLTWTPDGTVVTVGEILEGPVPRIDPVACRGVVEASWMVGPDDAATGADDAIVFPGSLGAEGGSGSRITVTIRIAAAGGAGAVLDGLSDAIGCDAYRTTGASSPDGGLVETSTVGVSIEGRNLPGVDGEVMLVREGMVTLTVDGSPPDPELFGEPPTAAEIAARDLRSYYAAVGPYAIKVDTAEIERPDEAAAAVIGGFLSHVGLDGEATEDGRLAPTAPVDDPGLRGRILAFAPVLTGLAFASDGSAGLVAVGTERWAPEPYGSPACVSMQRAIALTTAEDATSRHGDLYATVGHLQGHGADATVGTLTIELRVFRDAGAPDAIVAATAASGCTPVREIDAAAHGLEDGARVLLTEPVRDRHRLAAVEPLVRTRMGPATFSVDRGDGWRVPRRMFVPAERVYLVAHGPYLVCLRATALDGPDAAATAVAAQLLAHLGEL